MFTSVKLVSRHLLATAVLLLAGVATLAAQGYQIGDRVEDFSLMGTDGELHSIADDAGEAGTVVVFTCNHCPYSVAYEDRLIALQNKLAPMGYNLIAINPNDPEIKPADSFDNMKVRAEEKGFNFPYVVDEGQQVYPKWGATRTPHFYVVDAENTVRYIGALDNETDASKVTTTYLEDAIEAIAAGRTPDPATTKAIGCSIKAKS